MKDVWTSLEIENSCLQCNWVPEELYISIESELAALREELQTRTADLLECGTRRKAAEQRNTVLGEEIISLSTRLSERDKLINHIGNMISKAMSPNQKPTESGTSENAN